MKFLSLIVLVVACGDARTGVAQQPGAAICEVLATGLQLPELMRETSGLARSARDADLFWTHNDAGSDPEIFGITGAGRLVQRVRVTGAAAADWEDISTAPCESGHCLYVGDIGDNNAAREHITIYRFDEPAADVSETMTAVALYARFPDGPRDAEAMFAGRDGDLYIVSKGRTGPVALYRYPAPQRPVATVTLERVRELFAQPSNETDRVTSATSTPDGRWVGIRTYRTLYVYPADALLGGGAVTPTSFDLGALKETQGESLVMADDGLVWMSSEAEKKESLPTLSLLRCAYSGK